MDRGYLSVYVCGCVCVCVCMYLSVCLSVFVRSKALIARSILMKFHTNSLEEIGQ